MRTSILSFLTRVAITTSMFFFFACAEKRPKSYNDREVETVVDGDTTNAREGAGEGELGTGQLVLKQMICNQLLRSMSSAKLRNKSESLSVKR